MKTRAQIFYSEYDEAYEILNQLAEQLPEKCSCDFETDSEGFNHGIVCFPHRAEKFLNDLEAEEEIEREAAKIDKRAEKFIEEKD